MMEAEESVNGLSFMLLEGVGAQCWASSAGLAFASSAVTKAGRSSTGA